MFFLIKIWARMFYGTEAVEDFEERHRRGKIKKRPQKTNRSKSRGKR